MRVPASICVIVAVPYCRCRAALKWRVFGDFRVELLSTSRLPTNGALASNTGLVCPRFLIITPEKATVMTSGDLMSEGTSVTRSILLTT